MHLIIAGSGEMAQELFDVCEQKNIGCAFFDPYAPRVACSVAVHFGSGRQLEELHAYCSGLCIPIIQGSTGQTLPKKIGTPIVDAPNLALPIVYMMRVVAHVNNTLKLIGLEECSVKESHQATKTSVPGTAVRFAEAVGLAQHDIVSIREQDEQRKLGIPEGHLARHGYHFITWKHPDCEVEIRTRVHGLRPYALGVLTLAEKVVSRLSGLDSKVYPVTDFL